MGRKGKQASGQGEKSTAPAAAAPEEPAPTAVPDLDVADVSPAAALKVPATSEAAAEPEAAAAKTGLTPEEGETLARFDLTSRMTPYLDRHLIFPILHFLDELGIYNKKDITRSEIALLSETNMIDFVADKYKELGEEVPGHISKRRDEVLALLSGSCSRVLPLLQILESPEQLETVRAIKSVADICYEFELDPGIFDALVSYARLQFDCGNYSVSGDILKHYRSITSQDPDQPQTWRQMSSIWGSIASAILNLAHEDGAELIVKLDEVLEATKLTKREVLNQRAWLLHWSLFCIFQADGAQVKLFDLFLSEKSLSLMTFSCPHLFRYVCACLVLHRRTKTIMNDTVQFISRECTSYSDPITRFLLALYVDIEFDQAQLELTECELVCRGDYFLCKHWADFVENARQLIFEAYCRIHQCINIDMLASKLNMRVDEAEVWIVKLIQNAKLDARIDAEKGRVVMSKAPPSVYQQVIDKTKNLSFRTTMLLSNLEERETTSSSGKV